MPDPRVTVIVPAHNYGRYLPHALESVAAQTLAEWECIVVDDGSTDDTAAVAAHYVARDPRFRYLHQQNQGLSAARNSGLAAARGAYIQFLDADDRLAAGKLELHARFLDEHPETDVVYSEVAFFRDDDPTRLMPSIGGKLSRSIMARVHGQPEALARLEHYNIMPVLAALVRRSIIARAGTFDVEARACEDWGFWIRCAVAGARFDYLDAPAPLAAVRSHGASMSRDQRRMIDGLIAIARAFPRSEAARHWTRAERLPLAYEFAHGIEAVERGAHLAGARRIWRAARAASESLTAIRWFVYALAALLPRRLFLRVVMTPIPEGPFELYRRIRARVGR